MVRQNQAEPCPADAESGHPVSPADTEPGPIDRDPVGGPGSDRGSHGCPSRANRANRSDTTTLVGRAIRYGASKVSRPGRPSQAGHTDHKGQGDGGEPQCPPNYV